MVLWFQSCRLPLKNGDPKILEEEQEAGDLEKTDVETETVFCSTWLKYRLL